MPSNFQTGVRIYGVPMMPGPGVVPKGRFPKTQGQVGSYSGVLFVDGDNGSDANDGYTPQSALKNLDTAYNLTSGGLGEIIYVLGGSAAISYSSAIASAGAGLNWAKNYTHLVGLTNPLALGQRARLTNGASTNLLTPLLTVSGIGCLFQNLEIANVGSHATEAAVSLLVTGVRNSFIDCQISGGFTSTTAGNAAMRSLVIGASTPTPADENYFSHCYIGLDTIARSSTQTEVEILGGSARVQFEDCTFSTYSSAGTNFFLKIAANGIDRFVKFKRCQFINAYTFSGGTILADAFSVVAAPGGIVLLTDCLIVGVTALSASDTAIFGDNAYAAGTTAKAIALSW